jgi:hypothetical protein
MRFYAKSKDRTASDVVKDDSVKNRRGRSKKPVARTRNVHEDERTPTEEKRHRGNEDRDRSPRHGSRPRVARRGRDKSRDQSARGRQPSPQKGKKQAREKIRSKSRGRHKISEAGARRVRSSLPKKKGRADRRQRHASVPATKRLPERLPERLQEASGDRKVHRSKIGRRKKGRKEKHHDSEDFGDQAKALDELISTTDNAGAFNVSPYALVMPVDSSDTSIVDKERAVQESETMNTRSFEDATTDGCVARYDGIIYRVFDWVSVNTRDEGSLKEVASLEAGNSILETMYAEKDATDKDQSTVPQQYVGQRRNQSQAEWRSGKETVRFSWAAFFAEF